MQHILRKIVVICKYNQARSITAAAALRRFFPDQEIISAGIVAQANTPIPSSILQILDEWGLDERDHRSTSTLDLPKINPEDFIFCADEEVRSVFIQQLKLEQTLYPHIFILEEFSRTSLEIPIDPVSLSVAGTKDQLARSLVLAIRGLRKALLLQNVLQAGHLPATQQAHLEIQSQFLESNEPAQLIIDTGFSIPNPGIWSTAIQQVAINPIRLSAPQDPGLERAVLISRYETDQTAELLLSTRYFQWIGQLAQGYSLQVLSQPLEDLPPSRRHEAILGLIHS